MREIILACAVFAGFTGFASAGELGIASYYQNPYFGGLIAAHKTLPFGTRVKVFNLDNGRSAIVRIVDRGPFIRGRIIDVSPAAASMLGFRGAGLAHVRIDRI
jgi:rare lipoprotein A